MRFCLLASGSKGNCIWIEEGPRAVLVDNGLSCVDFMHRAKAVGLDTSRVKDIVVSHEHGDHIGGVGPLARKLGLNVYVTETVSVQHGNKLGNVRLKTFSPGQNLELGAITLNTLTSSHDTVDPVVFVAHSQGKSLGLVTDLGVVTGLILQSLRHLDALILEFNHDVEMLINGPYPVQLKQRVRSRQGHLSNDEAAEVFRELIHPGLKEIVLAHLSQTNNTPELARKAAEEVLASSPHRPNLTVADQFVPTAIMEI
jgi:phosphoribosyl 1,2-cyclic phosphodiesterase